MRGDDGKTKLRVLIGVVADGQDHYECDVCCYRFGIEKGIIPTECPRCLRKVTSG